MEKKFLEAKNITDIEKIIKENNDSLSVGIILGFTTSSPLYHLVVDYPSFIKAIEYYRDRTTEVDLIRTFEYLSYERQASKEKMEKKNKFFTLLLNKKTAGQALIGSVSAKNFNRVKQCLTFSQTQEKLNEALVTSVPLQSNPSLQIVKLLLEKGAKFGTRVNINDLLQDISEHSDEPYCEIVECILKEEEAKEYAQGIKDRALERAITLYGTVRNIERKSTLLNIIKILLEIGANPTPSLIQTCYEGIYNFPIGSSKETFELAKLLLQYGADPNGDQALLGVAVLHNREDLVKLFLEHKIDVHQEDDLGFKNACEFGYYNIAKMLLDAGAKISAFNQGPIREASRNGHDKIVKLLLKNGANPRVKNRQALTWARKNEHAKVIAILEKWFEEHDE